MEKFYTCEQIAERYGVKLATVWSWARNRKIGAVRIGRLYRIPESAVAAFDRQNTGTVDELLRTDDPDGRMKKAERRKATCARKKITTTISPESKSGSRTPS